MHVHVRSPDGSAKFWLEPRIELAQNWGLSMRDLRATKQVIEANQDEIRKAWRKRFAR
jgi:hypothetical protein